MISASALLLADLSVYHNLLNLGSYSLHGLLYSFGTHSYTFLLLCHLESLPLSGLSHCENRVMLLTIQPTAPEYSACVLLLIIYSNYSNTPISRKIVNLSSLLN